MRKTDYFDRMGWALIVTPPIIMFPMTIAFMAAPQLVVETPIEVALLYFAPMIVGVALLVWNMLRKKTRT